MKAGASNRKPGGRYSDALAASICDSIAHGNSLRSACRDARIDISLFFQWMRAHEPLAQQYARARESQGEVLADELREIADQATAENAQAIRVRVDTRKWIAARLAPKRYGERVAMDHSGEVSVNLAEGIARLRAAQAAK